MKESKPLLGFEPTAVRSKWFEVNNLNHSAMDAPSDFNNTTINRLYEYMPFKVLEPSLQSAIFTF
jgi:hypothetical protein